MSTSVLLADSHAVLREGLSSLLKGHSGYEVVAAVADGREAVRAAARARPDLVVLDVALPRLNGVEATRQILRADPGCSVIVLSAHQDHRSISRMLAAGAAAYVSKRRGFRTLMRAMEAVQEGRGYLSPEIAQLVTQRYVENLPQDDRLVGAAVLSGRERTLVELLADGCPTRRIAAHLGVSTQTVTQQRRHIMDKLGVESIAQLTKYALREGLTTCDDDGRATREDRNGVCKDPVG